MRLIDEASSEALEGSRPADTLTVWAWRDGELVVPDPLQVITWSTDDEMIDSKKVGQKLSLTIADPDGSLGAWKFDDALSVAGTELRVIYNIGGAGSVNYGKFRVTGNEPSEMIDSRVVDEYGYLEPDGSLPPHKRRVYLTTSVVKLEAVDLTFNVDRDKLWQPQSPPAGATVISEFRRLTKDYFPTVVDPGVTNRSISRKTIWDRERLEACQDMLSLIGARYRMGGDGECHIYPATAAPVMRIEPTAGLVSVARTQSVDGLYNAWVVEGKQDDGAPVIAVVKIEGGPLRFGGPHGRASYHYSSEMITSHGQATDYGLKLRDEFLNTLAIELSIETIPHPELQAGDRIEVGVPVAAGHVVYLLGLVNSIRRAGTTVPTGTSLTVTCSYADVIAALDRTEWAEHLTGTMPELTWDRMPGTWGALPAITWDSLP